MFGPNFLGEGRALERAIFMGIALSAIGALAILGGVIAGVWWLCHHLTWVS